MIRRFSMLVVLALLAFAASNVLVISASPMIPGWSKLDAHASYWYTVLARIVGAFLERVLPWLALVPLAVQTQKALGSPARFSTRPVLIHAFVCTAFSLTQLWVHIWFEPHTWRLYHFDTLYRTVSGLVYYLGYNLLPYAGAVVMHQASHHRRQFQQTALNEARLEASLARAQLESLRMRIHPHFIFNALQSINVLILDGQPDRASEMVERLSRLLRRSIDGTDHQLTTVDREIESVRGYLEIEAIRFHNRLRIDWEVAPSVSRALVPSLVLQPLVENAIKHGTARQTEPSVLSVSVDREGDTLVLRVRNQGPPLPTDWRLEDRAGFGLKATRQRLDLLYGREGSLTVRNAPGGGVETRVTIPYREEVVAPDGRAREWMSSAR